MNPTHLNYHLAGDVAILTLDDPASLNAVSPPLADDIGRALARASGEARAVILTGAGRAFCSGANLSLKAMSEDSGFDADAGSALERHYNPLVSQMRDLPIPLVTAVNGAAAGIGCSFALMGDLVIASDNAYFLQAFRRIALVPDGGATWLLTRAIGRARAMEMMLLGERIPATKALEWGLVNRVVPADGLMAEAMNLAENLAAGPTKTLALIRKAAWAGLDQDWASQLGLERDFQREAGRSADCAEGLSAFFQKRPPQFSGK